MKRDIPKCIIPNKSLTVLRTQLLFFILVQLRVSVVFDHYGANNTLLQVRLNMYVKYTQSVGTHKFTTTKFYNFNLYKIVKKCRNTGSRPPSSLQNYYNTKL